MSDRPRKDFPPEPSAPETADYSPEPSQTDEPTTDPPRLSADSSTSKPSDFSTLPLSPPPKVETSSLPTDQSPPVRASASELHFVPGRVLVGRYRLVRQLGKGGMGVVFLAHDDVLDTDIALKILPPESATDAVAVERFRKEVTLVRSVSHDGVCRVYEFREDGPVPFFTMELILGRNLRQFIRENELPADKVFSLLLDVAKALEQVHAKGVVHRDLKPENVLVRSTGEPVIVDFGLAKRSLADGATTTGIAGTSRYMSPEQHRGEQLDVRTDVFSFGIMAFELLMGVSPFGSGKDAEVITAILRDPPAIFESTELPADVVRAMQSFFVCALEKASKDRFASAGELRRALEEAWAGRGNGRASTQTPPPAKISVVPSEKPAVRWKGRLVALAIGLVLLVAIVANWPRKTELLASAQRMPKEFLACDPLRPTVVVGAFKNSSGDPALDSFTRGIPDSLRAHLRTSQKLHVVDSTPPLGPCATQWVVDGNVQKFDEKIRLSVEVRGAGGTSLVPPNVENGTSDAFDQLLEKTRDVLLDDLRRLARIKERDRRAFVGTKNEEARKNLFDYYRIVAVNSQPRKEDQEVGKKLVDHAIGLDRAYVPALVERAYLYALGVGVATRSEGVKKGISDLGQALEIAPNDPPALVLRCRLLRQAVEVDRNPTDLALRAAEDACEKALVAEPESGQVRLAYARLYSRRCDEDRVIESLEELLRLDHSLSDVALRELIDAALHNGRLLLADRRSFDLVEYEQHKRDGTPTSRGVHLLRGAVLLHLADEDSGKLLEAKRQFELEIESANAKESEKWAEAAAIRGLMQIARRGSGVVPVELQDRLAKLEKDAASAVNTAPNVTVGFIRSYQHVDPEAALVWLGRLGPPRNYEEAGERVLLLEQAGKHEAARKFYATLRPQQQWEETCHAWLGRTLLRQ